MSSLTVDLISGFAGGVSLCLVGHPFDTLKVLMQMQPANYPSLASAFKQTVTKHGLGGLYRGVGSPLIGNGLYNAVQFAVFGVCGRRREKQARARARAARQRGGGGARPAARAAPRSPAARRGRPPLLPADRLTSAFSPRSPDEGPLH